MYLRHFGLEDDPFDAPSTSAPDVLTSDQRSAVREIAESIREHRGLTALVGAQGVGKSTVLEAACRELPETIDVHVIEPGRLTPEGFYRTIFEELGVWERPSSVDDCVRRLQMHLLETAGRGIHTVVVVDHAHDLPLPILGEVGKLHGLEPWLQIVMVGRPELVERLLDPELGDLHERFAVASVLEPLSETGLAELLQARLAACDGSPELFGPEAIVELRRLSGGLPGKALRVADVATRLAYGRGLDAVDDDSVRRAARGASVADRTPVRPPRIDPDTGPARRAVASGAAGGTSMAVADVRPARTPPEPWWVAAVPASASPSPRSRPAAGSRPTAVGGSRRPALLRSVPFRRGERRVEAHDWDPDPMPPELLAVLDDPHGIAAEQFRVLRLKLESWIDRRGGRSLSLLITSAGAGEGKTIVAANLALILAAAHPGRVLLVDGDLRRPRIDSLFHLPRRPGFADLLAVRNDLDDTVHYVSRHSLSIVPSGRPGNPRDLMSADRIEPVLEEMLGRFDLVLVDGTPLQPMVDARSLAGSVDGVLVAVRAGRTRYPELSKALRSIGGERLLGAVMTCVEDESVKGYGSYYQR